MSGEGVLGTCTLEGAVLEREIGRRAEAAVRLAAALDFRVATMVNEDGESLGIDAGDG